MCSPACCTQALVFEDQMRYIFSPFAALSHLLSHNMIAYNGLSRSFKYTSRWWDAKLEESDLTEQRSCWWYPWQHNFSNFFFSFSKRSEAEQELLKNYIPPTHLRPPWSLFNFLEVASEGVWGRLVIDPKGRWRRWRGSSHSCSRIVMTGKRGWWTCRHFFASLTDLCNDEVRISTTH